MSNFYRFSVNGKTYNAEEIDFYFMAYLDKCGVDSTNIMGPAAMNCFFSYCSGLDERQAAKEITEHTINNKGKMPEELIETYRKLLEESGFFRALLQESEQETAEEEEPVTEEASKTKRKRKTEPASE